MSNKVVPPSVTSTAFSCPHCGAYTTQYWYRVGADQRSEESSLPNFPTAEQRRRVAETDLEPSVIKEVIEYFDRVDVGLVFLEDKSKDEYFDLAVSNLNLSKCYNCSKVAVWVYKNIVFPKQRTDIIPSEDCPASVLQDFEEARGIVDVSPRGAAALLRLCVQKLCAHLGEKGENINSDIASLVGKGLNPTIQKALDAVRVIGNEAVHPGELNLRDDRDTALTLFGLVNLIVEQMITIPKGVQEIYDRIPVGKKAAIEQRNAKALTAGE